MDETTKQPTTRKGSDSEQFEPAVEELAAAVGEYMRARERVRSNRFEWNISTILGVIGMAASVLIYVVTTRLMLDALNERIEAEGRLIRSEIQTTEATLGTRISENSLIAGAAAESAREAKDEVRELRRDLRDADD